MTKQLSGKPAAAALYETLRTQTAQLRTEGVNPTLCVVRLGEEPSDLSYERGILNRAASVGVEVRQAVLSRQADVAALISLLREQNADPGIHGVLLLRPLPAHLKASQAQIANALLSEKDVDGMTDGSAAGVFLGNRQSFAPCTASACIELLRYYEIDPCGKRAVVVGRSAVVGRPLAQLLLAQNATVTICHTKTKDLSAMTRQAELLFACAGSAGLLTKEYISPGTVVLDVGVNWSEAEGRYVGDVLPEAAEDAAALTPVPGGVGAVTTACLLRNVVEAAIRQREREA